nr:unnamed protein product [Callosobruchus analis]
MGSVSKRKPGFLKILSWNADGLKDVAKKRELATILGELSIDVIRCDRLTGRGGGTAVVVKRNVDYCRGVNPILTSIESTSVVVNMEDGYSLKLISTYGICGGRIHEADLDSLLDFTGPLIAVGDWNAKHSSWGSRRNCPSGIRIYNHSLNSNFFIHSTVEPTHYPYNPEHAPDVIDFAMSRNCHYQIDIQVSHDLHSDHLPIILEVGMQVENGDDVTVRRINWETYKNCLSDFPEPPTISDVQELNATLATWTRCVQEAMESASVTHVLHPKKPNLPYDIKLMIREKRRAVKQARRTRAPADIRTANNLVHSVRNAIFELRNEEWSNFLGSLLDSGMDLWRIAKSLRSKGKEKIPPLQGENGIVYLDAEKVEVFGDVMEEQFSPNENQNGDIHEAEYIDQYVTEYFRSLHDQTLVWYGYG